MNSNHRKLKRAVLILIAALAVPLYAEVSLAPLFQDGAILQQGKPVPVWGKASPGEKIEVVFGAQKKLTTADGSGKWKALLDPLAASSLPAEMTVTGGNTLTVKDILVGEVWLCSGQSNMELQVSRAKDYPQESAAADFPQIRQFRVPKAVSDAPLATVDARWVTCNPETVKNFTAAGYFFARELYQTLKVPVGLINASYGGTLVEAWMSDEALRSDAQFAAVFKRWNDALAAYPNKLPGWEAQMVEWNQEQQKALAAGQEFKKRAPAKPEGPGAKSTPSGLFNAMIHPVLPYAIQGVLWYQGEANAPRFTEYANLFKAMITQWRRDFGQGDLPFYFVQLANYEKVRSNPDDRRELDASGQQWAFQREAQSRALTLPLTGMAVTLDIGEPLDIHPKNKQEVGRRLACIALAKTYGRDLEFSGPVFDSAKVEGNSIRVRLSHSKGMKIVGDATSSFEIAGEDRVFQPAEARVERDTIIVSSPSVKEPVAVRYAWRNNPSVVLFNEAGLPAGAFRSDDWPAVKPAPAQATAVESGENP